MVLQELEHRDTRMPVKCCTIIAWSCASLRVFRNSLFKVLARLATANLEQCQSYEMTNIMWAFGELCKSRRQLGKDLKDDLDALLEATCRVFASRPFGGWKLQVLMSALVSLTILPWQPASQRLFTDIAAELAQRQAELANEKTKPLTMAFNELRNKKPQAGGFRMFLCLAVIWATRHPLLRWSASRFSKRSRCPCSSTSLTSLRTSHWEPVAVAAARCLHQALRLRSRRGVKLHVAFETTAKSLLFMKLCSEQTGCTRTLFVR